MKSESTNSVSIGSGSTRLAEVNVDVDIRKNPDIVADAMHLPFLEKSFEEVILSDVIEHLPPGTELRALDETRRILRPGGRLILSTPNDRLLFFMLDPARIAVGHRHYSTQTVTDLVEAAGLKLESVFTAGWVFTMIAVLWYSLVTFPAHKLLALTLPYSPRFLTRLDDHEYRMSYAKHGYTIFVTSKVSPNELR